MCLCIRGAKYEKETEFTKFIQTFVDDANCGECHVNKEGSLMTI